MPEYNIDALVDLGFDKQQAAKTLQLIQSVENNLEQLGKIGVDVFGNDVTKATNKAIAAQSKLEAQTQDNIRAVQRYNDEFDKVSRDVGLAGDVQSNLGAFSGILGAAGQSDLAGAVAVFGELSAGVEEVARLKAAIAGFPSTIGAAVQALGPGGVAAAAGVALVTAAFAALDEQAKKNAENYNRAADAVRELNKDIEDGITSQELATRRQEVLNNRNAEEQTLRQLQATYDAYIEQKGVLAGAVQVVSREEEALADQIRQSEEAIRNYSQDIQGLEGAMDSARVAANDAEAAFAAMNDEMAQLAATNDNLMIDGLNTLDAAFGKTAEQIQEEIDGMNRRKELIIQLLNSQQLSEDATKRLRDELGLLNGRLILLTDNVLGAAQAADAANAALEDRQRQEAEAISATKKFNDGIVKLSQETNDARLKAEQDYADKIVDLTRKYNEDLADANRDLGREMADLVTDSRRDTADAQRKAQFDRLQEIQQFNNDTAKQARDLQRDLLKIRADSAAQEEDLIRNRDFAGLRNLRQDRNRALDDAVDSFNAEQREREIAFRQQQQQTNQQLQFEAETRRIQFEQRIADARVAYARELEDLQINKRRQEQVLADARRRELSLIANTQTSKLQLLSQAYNQELRLAAQSAQQRIAIQQQANQALLAQANAFRAVFGAARGGGNSITQTFQQTFQSGGSANQNVALAGVIAAEVGRQIKSYLG